MKTAGLVELCVGGIAQASRFSSAKVMEVLKAAKLTSWLGGATSCRIGQGSVVGIVDVVCERNNPKVAFLVNRCLKQLVSLIWELKDCQKQPVFEKSRL